MPDIFNSRIARTLKPMRAKEFAIVFGQTAYYTCSEDEVPLAMRFHEDCHKMQWAREGRIKFILKYLWQSITKGYINNEFEVEARSYAERMTNGNPIR